MYKNLMLTIIAIATLFNLRFYRGMEAVNKAIILSLVIFGFYSAIKYFTYKTKELNKQIKEKEEDNSQS